MHTITNSNCVLAIYSGLISNSNIGYELGYAAANNILTVIAPSHQAINAWMITQR